MANFLRRRADKRLLGQQNHTFNAAKAFQDAMYSLGAAMVGTTRTRPRVGGGSPAWTKLCRPPESATATLRRCSRSPRRT